MSDGISYPSTVVVTGSEGYIGQSVVDELVGLADIVRFDINAAPLRNIRNSIDIDQAIPIDDSVVIHLAAEADVGVPFDHAFNTNCVGTRNLAKYCSRNNVPILNVSSIAAQNPDTSDYAMSKYMQEQIVSRFDVSAMNVRLPNVVGRNHQKGNVRHMIEQGIEDQKIEAWYDGEGVREYVPVTRVAEMLTDYLHHSLFTNSTNKLLRGQKMTTETVANIVAVELEKYMEDQVAVECVDKEASSPRNLAFNTNQYAAASAKNVRNAIREQTRLAYEDGL